MTISIQIHELGISFAHKTCFENFSTQVNYGDRIAIIGQNGSGKSTLIKILQNQLEPSSGKIQISKDVIFGYVPQVIYEFESLSGGQRLNQALTKALSVNPNILLLDEPTNHLDYSNRKSLMRMLNNYPGTLIAVSHDVEFLQNCVDTLWHIDNSKIHIFSGNYDDYMREVKIKRTSIEQDLSMLDRQKKDAHQALMKEQERASKRKAYGEKKYADDKLALRAAQGKGENTHNKNKKNISNAKDDLLEKLSSLRLPEVLTPKFSLKSADLKDCILVSITDGSVSYKGGEIILQNINLSLSSKSRIALQGDNGSGKSTLLKAILGDKSVIKSGNWYTPRDIGYLDQHYSTLSLERSALETIAELAPTWNHAEIRKHLNDFLFRKNEEVNAKVSQLSGGEKLRLSLAQIAAKTQNFLILDEITNNVDLPTKNHIMEFLNTYPGGYIIVCHDNAFLEKLYLNEIYLIKNKTLLHK
ncbi:MAG: ABC-F family ATP-binding cassette domain-containing protein [Proteobacteria bacterium]|nr:ABC-F family ATP-binding cassette domain-containing protein [Pseudomonadota bacterium]